LRPNPPRYDSEGDEIDENEDVDSETEAAAAEENPFAEIALERTFGFLFSRFLICKLIFFHL
jgi:hypothetical protein